MFTYPHRPEKPRFWAGPLERYARRALWESDNNFPMPDPNANSQTKYRVSVDAGGRILLPKKIRQRLGLAAGDELDVEFPVTALADAGEDAILLRVVRPEVPLHREGKFWVYRGGEAPAPVNINGMIAAEREGRSESILPGSTGFPSTEEGSEA
jgi:AbrB family looped-hinge helix DNA binding protein